MGGACQLASTSAFRIGSGMVRIYTAWDNRESLLRKLPEAIIDTYADDEQEGLSEEETDRLQKGISWADVIAIGAWIIHFCKGWNNSFLCTGT